MSVKMKNCKACGKEVSPSAKSCPSCGQKLKAGFIKKALIGIIGLIVLGIAIAALGDKPSTTTSSPGSNKPTMTKAEFDQLKDGMSYEDATSIIGGPGEMSVESGKKGEALHTVIYQYKGEGDLGANANVTFQGNKLNMKAQMGLK